MLRRDFLLPGNLFQAPRKRGKRKEKNEYENARTDPARLIFAFSF